MGRALVVVREGMVSWRGGVQSVTDVVVRCEYGSVQGVVGFGFVYLG